MNKQRYMISWCVKTRSNYLYYACNEQGMLFDFNPGTTANPTYSGLCANHIPYRPPCNFYTKYIESILLGFVQP